LLRFFRLFFPAVESAIIRSSTKGWVIEDMWIIPRDLDQEIHPEKIQIVPCFFVGVFGESLELV